MRSKDNPEKVMTVMEHIAELRNGILISLLAFLVLSIVAFIFSNDIIQIFTKPFAGVASSVDKKLVVTNIIEGFSTQVQVAVISGLILSLPVHIFNLLKFVFPGIEPKHKRIILVFLIASLILIVIGAYIAYFKVVPLAIGFLTSTTFIPKGVGYLLNYRQNIFYVFSFILWSLAALQTPLILELLLMFNVLNRKQVFHASRYIIVGIFVVAAIITPPDFISQLGVALPLTLLFFIALLVAKIFKFGESN
jgi:sec-independent protein translocase protein TatC